MGKGKKKAKDFAASQSDEIKDKPTPALDVARKRDSASGLADEVAGSKLCYRHWYFSEGIGKFPHRPHMRSVGRYYPEAVNGPLLVDEPMYPHEIDDCAEKANVLRALGYRYLIIEPGDTMADIIDQLEIKS